MACMIEHFAVGWTDYREASQEEAESLLDGTFDPAPTLLDVDVMPDGTLVLFDMHSGLYTIAFDDANPAPPPPMSGSGSVRARRRAVRGTRWSRCSRRSSTTGMPEAGEGRAPRAGRGRPCTSWSVRTTRSSSP